MTLQSETMTRPLAWLRISQALLALAAAWVISSPALASATARPDLDATLPNGLRVVVYEDRRAPTALHMVWIRAGSMDERNGQTGVAHVLEHMMFKGTKTLKPGEFSRRVAALGGRENAFTAHEYTGYFQQVHKDALSEVMALEADRMQNLRITEAEFAKEIQVVMEERRLRTDDSASGRAYEALMATALTTHPMRNPIIGWMGDLQSLTVQDARDWYDRFYSPDRATVIVAGDVDAQAVLAEVKALYGGWAPRPAVDQRPQPEPAALGPRWAEVDVPAQFPSMMLAWRMETIGPGEPGLTSQDPKARRIIATALLASLLDHPDFGRLTEKLVRGRQIARSLSTSADSISRGPGFFMLQATPVEGTGLAELKSAILAELAVIAREGVPESDLQLIRRLVRASEIYAQDSVFSRAMEAGRTLAAGRPLEDIAVLDQLLLEVTPQEVQAAAQALLADRNTTQIDLRPLPSEQQKASRRAFGPNLLRH